MSYCQCRLKLVFTSIFRQFGWKHVALLLDRSDLFSLTVGKLIASSSGVVNVSFAFKLNCLVACTFEKTKRVCLNVCR